MAEDKEDRKELVITRKPGEAVWLDTRGGSIKITQLARWRLAIQAPPEVIVSREDRTDRPDEPSGNTEDDVTS